MRPRRDPLIRAGHRAEKQPMKAPSDLYRAEPALSDRNHTGKLEQNVTPFHPVRRPAPDFPPAMTVHPTLASYRPPGVSVEPLRLAATARSPWPPASPTRYFREIVAAVAELDVEVALHGELVRWNKGRIDFAAACPP